MAELGLPSGKRLQKNMEHSTIFMGKSTISMAIFNSKLLVYQRVRMRQWSVLVFSLKTNFAWKESEEDPAICSFM